MRYIIVFKIIFVVGILIVGFFLLNKYIYDKKQGNESNIDSAQTDNKTDNVSFTWKFEDAQSLNPDGNPNTNVYLEKKYESGGVVTKLIDTTPGGCSELPETEKDSVPGSKNIQCYYAGFGYQYKIVKRENSYFIMRKTFEEGSPDLEPTPQQYEIFSEISF